MLTNKIIRRLAAVVLLLATFVCSYAQDDSARVSMRSSMLGVGSANVLDTYLSPYNYTGPELRIMRETMRMTRLMGGKVSNQTMIDFNVSYLENRAGTANEWAGGVRYSIGWHYNVALLGDEAFHLSKNNGKSGDLGMAFGPMLSGYLGGVYNTRNGNNPAQAKADICIDLSAMLYYNLRLFKRNILLRYQMTVPMLGVAFSPNYGQSYYELFSLGHYDHNVVFAHVGNMPSMRHLFTADIPLGRSTLRVGYGGQFNQAEFNNLRYHSYSHNFLLGFVKRVTL